MVALFIIIARSWAKDWAWEVLAGRNVKGQLNPGSSRRRRKRAFRASEEVAPVMIVNVVIAVFVETAAVVKSSSGELKERRRSPRSAIALGWSWFR
jgi:hypothetical protein